MMPLDGRRSTMIEVDMQLFYVEFDVLGAPRPARATHMGSDLEYCLRVAFNSVSARKQLEERI